MLYNKPELVRIVADTAKAEGVDAALVMSIVDVLSQWSPSTVEQSMDPMSFNPVIARHKSPEQRLGLLQIPTDKAVALGFKQTTSELLEPALNTRIGCLLLKQALIQTGGEAGRAILITYGYAVGALIPQIQAKVPMYKEFLAKRPD